MTDITTSINEILARAKQAAVDYYRLTGKPLGITGEVGEYEAARLLGLALADARAPGYDATDEYGVRYPRRDIFGRYMRANPSSQHDGAARVI